jgi:hypothetical protein
MIHRADGFIDEALLSSWLGYTEPRDNSLNTLCVRDNSFDSKNNHAVRCFLARKKEYNMFP